MNTNADINEMKERHTREDQELVDYLEKEKIYYVDMNEIFLHQLQQSNVSGAEFMKTYLVNGAGHFNPMGNHFIAYSIRTSLSNNSIPSLYLISSLLDASSTSRLTRTVVFIMMQWCPRVPLWRRSAKKRLLQAIFTSLVNKLCRGSAIDDVEGQASDEAHPRKL